MKRSLLLLTILLVCLQVSGQYYYPEIASYATSATPSHGIKIKTNLPFVNNVQMPTVFIQGYNYNTGAPIELAVVWYIYNGNFMKYGVSSSGAYAPEIKLAIEENKVVIYINDRQYFQRFFVSAFAKLWENPSWFSGWTTVDEPLNGTNVVTVPYRNDMKGEVRLPGGIWNTNGSVGIGTTNTRDDKLAVNGTVRANEVKVEAANWPDYVFDADYPLRELSELETYIKANGHLPGIPTEAEVLKEGVNLGEMNAILLEKIEELMLYLLRQSDMLKQQQQLIGEQQKQIDEIMARLPN